MTLKIREGLVNPTDGIGAETQPLWLSNSCLQKVTEGSGELAQPMKCQPGKHEILNLGP